MNKEQEDWKEKQQWYEYEIMVCQQTNALLQRDRDEYKALFESAIKKGQELIQENASLSNKNELLQEDNLSLSKALSEIITKMKAEHEETA